jgi:hypothetical protein
LANGALLTTLHPLFENVLKTVYIFRRIVEQAVLTFHVVFSDSTT